MEGWLPEDFKIIRELRSAVAKLDDRVWTLFEILESAIGGDPRRTSKEGEMVRRARLKAAEAFLAKQKGLNLDNTPALAALGALETSIRKRTTGPDGWRLG
jgi:hypothetical protein